MNRASIVIAASLIASLAGAATLPGAPPKKKGSLDKEVIRRVIRSHLDEIKDCYEKGLADKPELAGRVLMEFTIMPSGDVSGASVAENGLHDVPVETCISSAILGWKFPAPLGGGLVIVKYPFILKAAAE